MGWSSWTSFAGPVRPPTSYIFPKGITSAFALRQHASAQTEFFASFAVLTATAHVMLRHGMHCPRLAPWILIGVAIGRPAGAQHSLFPPFTRNTRQRPRYLSKSCTRWPNSSSAAEWPPRVRAPWWEWPRGEWRRQTPSTCFLLLSHYGPTPPLSPALALYCSPPPPARRVQHPHPRRRLVANPRPQQHPHRRVREASAEPGPLPVLPGAPGATKRRRRLAYCSAFCRVFWCCWRLAIIHSCLLLRCCAASDCKTDCSDPRCRRRRHCCCFCLGCAGRRRDEAHRGKAPLDGAEARPVDAAGRARHRRTRQVAHPRRRRRHRGPGESAGPEFVKREPPPPLGWRGMFSSLLFSSLRSSSASLPPPRAGLGAPRCMLLGPGLLSSLRLFLCPLPGTPDCPLR